MIQQVKSQIEGINWPALPASTGAARLALLFQLEQTQWWPPEKIKKQQFVQLASLLRFCIKHVPYYSQLENLNLSLENLNEEQWAKIPILSRDSVQQAGNALVSKLVPADHGKASMQRTSGSTGKPVETLKTEMNIFLWNVFTLRDHLWHRRDFSKKLAVIRFAHDEQTEPPNGKLFKQWGSATSGVYDTGECVVLNVFTPIAEQVRWLKKMNPDYLLTHPSVLREVALYCQRNKIQLSSLQEVRTISESLSDGLRSLCKQVWNVPLVDLYSTIELGYLALQCPEYEHYHVQSEGVLLEVLDDNNKPCRVGEVGRVVVTNLHNFAFPLIRYEVGDYAEVGEPCTCGRGLPVIKRILGRYRNMLITASGERRYPQLGIQSLHEIAPVLQLQAVQYSLDNITVNVVLERPLKEKERQLLKDKFRVMLGESFNIDLQQVTQIKRSESGKYEDFLSML